MRRLLAPLCTIAMCLVAGAQNVKIAYLGLGEGESAAFCERFDEQIRDKLAAAEGVYVIDYLETQRLRERIRFEYFPTVSRDLAQRLMRFAGDTTLIVWGRVDQLSIQPKRHRLFGARAQASLQLVLTMYSLSYREYVFVGTAQSRTTRPLPPVFFDRVDKVSHISAAERTEMMRELAAAAADKAVRLIGAVSRSELAREEPIVLEDMPAEGVEVRKEPTLEDLFEIPTMEAPALEEEGREQPETSAQEQGESAPAEESPPEEEQDPGLEDLQ
jgi:hypothetical protein